MSVRSGYLAFSALALVAATAGPAGAQYYGGYGAPYPYNAPPPPQPYWFGNNAPPPGYGAVRPLRPNAVVDRLEDQGYEDVARPRFGGGTYTVDATAPGGLRVRLAVDAVRGIILNTVVLGRARPRDDDDDDRMSPRELKDTLRAYPPPGARHRDPETVDRAQGAPPASAGLPPPADERLVPGSERARREARRAQPDLKPDLGPRPGAAAKPATPAVEPIRPDAGAKPYGVNPDGAAAGSRPAARQASRPATPDTGVPAAKTSPVASPDRPAATGAKPSAGPSRPATPSSTATAEADRKKAVRVIPGVTPFNPVPNGEAQLNQLPEQPPVPPPTGTD